MCLSVPAMLDLMVQGGTTTVTEGTPITLNCPATGADPAVTTYMWSRAGVVMTTETMSTYTFIPVAADDGVTYSCAVDNGAQTADSLTLTVNSKLPG